MLELENILVIIEPDEDDQPALERATQLAQRAGASLELMIADYNAYLDDGFYFDPVQAQKLRYEHGDAQLQQLESLAQPLRDAGLEVSALTAWGNPPYEQVVNRIKETRPSLVVKSTRHHSKVARMLLSNEDWELVRYCPAPLLLVKGGEWQENPVFLAAVDPDHVHDKPAALDGKLIGAAQSLAGQLGGSFKLFHSAWVPPLSGVYPITPDVEEEENKLDTLADKYQVPREDCIWSAEVIDKSLPEAAEVAGAAGVIMGAVSRSRLDRVLIGATAERILDKLDCDVLVVKPDGFQSGSQVLV